LKMIIPWYEDHGQSNISGQPKMAPNLAPSHPKLIHDMIISGELLRHIW
jgi:hypothetical protein